MERLDVEPLTPSAAAKLAAGLLGAPLSERLADLVTDRCAGRPLLIETVTRTLTETNALERRDGSLHLRPGADLPLPAGVQARPRAG